VRGTANQVFEKYQALARDAHSAGDRIGEENYLQHAEHYYRLVNANIQNERQRQQQDGASGDKSPPANGAAAEGAAANGGAGASAGPSDATDRGNGGDKRAQSDDAPSDGTDDTTPATDLPTSQRS
jgi:hypothetical protein